MREIKAFGEEVIDEYIELAYNTYPSFKDFSPEGKAEFKELVKIRMNDKNTQYYGVFEDDELIAAVRYIEFDMNLYNNLIRSAGIASLAVKLTFKKQRVAKMLIDFLEDLSREKGIILSMLLPFRLDFYKKMGYGFGTKMNRYRFSPLAIPKYEQEAKIAIIEHDDLGGVFNCYNNYFKKTHGMLNKMDEEIYEYETNPNNLIVANYENNEIDGYLLMEFENGKSDNYTINNLIVKEFIYNSISSFKKLLDFIRKQADQVQLVVFDTLDDNFAYAIDNPASDTLNYIPFGYLETNTQAIGNMYKILDVKQSFVTYSFMNFNNISTKYKLIIIDENDDESEYIVNHNAGLTTVDATEFDYTIKLHLRDFSVLFLGCVNAISLYNLGLLEIDNKKYLNEFNNAYYSPIKPKNNTDF